MPPRSEAICPKLQVSATFKLTSLAVPALSRSLIRSSITKPSSRSLRRRTNTWPAIRFNSCRVPTKECDRKKKTVGRKPADRFFVVLRWLSWRTFATYFRFRDDAIRWARRC